MMVVVIGGIAAALSVASFVPQAWRVIRTRETKDLATPMWIMNVCGFVLWTVYGACLRAWPIIASPMRSRLRARTHGRGDPPAKGRPRVPGASHRFSITIKQFESGSSTGWSRSSVSSILPCRCSR